MRLLSRALRLPAYACSWAADVLAPVDISHTGDESPLTDIEAEEEVLDPQWVMTAPGSFTLPDSSAVTIPQTGAADTSSAGADDSPPTSAPAEPLSFADFITPAITDVLASHQHHIILDQCDCGEPMDEHDWREHAAQHLAERIETALLSSFPK